MIRRLLAFVTLIVFLLNVLGYYGILLGIKELSGGRMAKRLETEMYDLGGNLTIKVPLAIPFETTAEHFEGDGGQFEMDGQVFRVMKKRHYNDTLYIVCIKDDRTTRINSALEDHVQSYAGKDNGTDKQTPVPGLIKDFISGVISLASSGIGWEKDIQWTSLACSFLETYSVSITHPPARA